MVRNSATSLEYQTLYPCRLVHVINYKLHYGHIFSLGGFWHPTHFDCHCYEYVDQRVGYIAAGFSLFMPLYNLRVILLFLCESTFAAARHNVVAMLDYWFISVRASRRLHATNHTEV